MDDIQRDLDVIRAALARSSCHGPAAASTATTPPRDERRDGHGGGDADGGGRQMGAASCPSGEAARDHDAAELTRLREQVGALSSCELERARLEVELASREASLRQSAQAQYALQQQEKGLQEQLQRATAELQERQAELVVWRERHQRLTREADALRRELDALAGQCDRLESAVGELREAVRQAGDENVRLRGALHETRAECEALRLRQAEHDAVVAREAALRDELQAVRATGDELREYFEAAQAEIDARRQLWAAVHEEHDAQREALLAAQEAAAAWEARFVASLSSSSSLSLRQQGGGEVGSGPELTSTAARGEANDGRSHDDEEGEEAKNSEEQMAALEAKIVDLALHLREQQEAAAAAETCFATLAATITRECRELLDARRTLATQRPEWTHLSEINLKLQAELLARESHVEALQEILISLLDEHTEQSLYCYELETQLAVKVTRGGGASTSARGGSAAPRRCNALHLLQQQQQSRMWGGSGLK